MIKVWQYSMYDLIRSRWTYIYFLFYLVTTMGLLHISNTLSMTIVSLVNIITILIPLIGTIFGAIYFYNSKEFIELLLAQPIRRRSIFLGQYLGLATSLAISYSLGVALPFLIRSIWLTDQLGNFMILLAVGILLTFIFVGLAYLVALSNNNRMKGFGLAIIIWLFLAVIYDGLFILSLIVFEDYPLESFSLITSMLNPIDLSRILIMLKLDVAALLGYTGAVFNKFLGAGLGVGVAFTALIAWVILPLTAYLKIAAKKDF